GRGASSRHARATPRAATTAAPRGRERCDRPRSPAAHRGDAPPPARAGGRSPPASSGRHGDLSLRPLAQTIEIEVAEERGRLAQGGVRLVGASRPAEELPEAQPTVSDGGPHAQGLGDGKSLPIKARRAVD